MKRLIDIIGIIVLLGILLKLSYVFVYLFSELDNGSLVAKTTGVTFAFASIWFVIKVHALWLKITVILLDVATILYYYLHVLFEIPVEYAAIIVAAYSGLIVFYVGRIVNEKIKTDNDTLTDRLRSELHRLRTDNDIRNLEAEIQKTRRRISDSRRPETTEHHKNYLNELEKKYLELKKITQ